MAYTPETLRQIAESQNLFVWEMPEHEHHARTPNWFLVVSLITMASVIYGIWSANYLFGLIILISAVILMLAGNEEPNHILVQVGHNGVVLDGNFVPFDKLHNFSIIYHPPFTKVLYLERKYSLKPRLKVYLENEDPVAIREHLLRYLPENLVLRDEHFSDIVGRLLRI
ncbi:MAG: hypothetical protein WC750_03825 [Patescibacteria group bacterium]|jgi:hypothetical protein